MGLGFPLRCVVRLKPSLAGWTTHMDVRIVPAKGPVPQ